MARSKRKQFIHNDWSGGIQNFTSPLWVKTNEAPFALNVDVSTPGILKKSRGYEEVGTESGTDPVLGLGVFTKADGTSRLLRVTDGSLDEWNGTTTWVNKSTAITSASYTEMVNAVIDDTERIYMSFGLSENIGYYDGSTFSQITGVKAKHIAYYKNRLYLGNVDLGTVKIGRVQYSGLGVDTFDTDVDFFDDVGDAITGLKVYANKLNIFSDDKLYSYDGYALVEIPGDFGTPASRSIQVVQGRLLWFNRRGVYMYAAQGLPTLISRKVQAVIDAITDYTAVAAGVDYQGRYKLYIGDVRIDGLLYNNVVLTYDVLIDAWTIEDDKPFNLFATERKAGSFVTYAGDKTTSKVWKIDTGTSDDGAAIASEWQTAVFDFKHPETTKNFYEVHVTMSPTGNSEYLTFEYRLDGASTWQTIESTANNVDMSGSESLETVVLRLSGVQGKNIQFKISHSSDSGSFALYDVRVEADEIPQN